jgi:hypothetical protein
LEKNVQQSPLFLVLPRIFPNISTPQFFLTNSGFIRQLMDYERKLTGTCTLHWDDTDSKYSSVVDWLKANDDPQHPPSHFWWEILTKQAYHIPPNKLDEFYSEVAKGITRNETMKVVEMRDNVRKYKLHLDLDIKASEKAWNDSELLEYFKDDIQKIIQKYIKEDTSFVVTGVSGRFFPLSQPDVTYKYGFHFVWPNVLITVSQHKEIMSALINHFQHSEIPISKDLNSWDQIFDMSIIDNEVSGFRMLYSIKSFTCKICRKKEENKVKKVKQCLNCLDTGVLDTR